MFDVFELPNCLREHSRLGVHSRAVTDWLEHYIANRQSDQIGRNRLLHLEAVNAFTGRLSIVGVPLGPHDR